MAAIGPGSSAIPNATAVGKNISNTVANTTKLGANGTTLANVTSSFTHTPGTASTRNIFVLGQDFNDTTFPSGTALDAAAIFPDCTIVASITVLATWTWDTGANLETRFPSLFGKMTTGQSFRFTLVSFTGTTRLADAGDASVTMYLNNVATSPLDTTAGKNRPLSITKTGTGTYRVDSVGQITISAA